MIDLSQFSPQLLRTSEATNPGALERIALAKRRIQSVLDRETISHQKTLEQKISDQGPKPQRVDPHLVGLAIKDLLSLNRLRAHRHKATSSQSWYANPATTPEAIDARLDQLAPLYASITGDFSNHIGDALEIVTYRCLQAVYDSDRLFAFQGMFHLNRPKSHQGRYTKTPPPKTIGSHNTTKEADFIQFGHQDGPLCVECKNYREWIYPHHQIIKELIIKAAGL